MSRCYIDASALVKLGTVERETDALRQQLAGFAARFTSRITTVEVPRALARKPEAIPPLRQDWSEHVSIIELNDAIAAVAADLRPPVLRSLDAIHVASALSVRDEIDAFITYDVRLADAARAHGLTVVAPA